MTGEQAMDTVRRERERLEIDEDLAIESAELSIVEFLPDRENPGPATDRVAWIVDLGCDWGYAKVHVDDRSGDILTVLRSA